MAKKGRRARNPLKPPNLQKLLGSQSVYRPPKDIDAQVENRVNLETAPAVNAINRSRQMGQHMYALQSEEARGWQTGLVGLLTGGKTGAEAESYSKQNFGGSYLAGIAMQEGTKLLTQISNDFNMKDWDYAAQVAEVMDQVPGLREKFRADILSEGAQVHQLNFDNRLKLASMVLDDWYKRVGLDMAAKELGFNMGSTRTRLKQDQQTINAKIAADRKAHQLAVRKERNDMRKDIAAENKDRNAQNQIDIPASIDLGVWVNKRGQAVAAPPGYKNKPPRRFAPTSSSGGGEGGGLTPRRKAMVTAGQTLAGMTRNDFMYEPAVGPPITLSYRQGFAKAKGLVYDELKAYGYSDARINRLVKARIKRFNLPNQKKR